MQVQLKLLKKHKEIVIELIKQVDGNCPPLCSHLFSQLMTYLFYISLKIHMIHTLFYLSCFERVAKCGFSADVELGSILLCAHAPHL